MMPLGEKILDTRFDSWSAPEVPWKIEYPPEVMDQIRAYACDSLLQLSHGGRDVGGVLFGLQRQGVIRILTWRRITCEYVDGETMRLSHRDRMNLAVEFEAARINPELKEFRPVGWFVSHPGGGVAMTPEDLETFSGFFPESWQLTLVLHPTEGGRADAGFFLREADGSVRSQTSYRNFILEPVHPMPAEARPVQPAAPDVARAPKAQDRTAPVLDLSDIPTPVFQTDEPLPARDRWLWAIPIVLALGLGGWLLYQKQKPVEPPALAFRISASSGRTAELEWDANSRAVRNAQRGEIDITDGGKSSQVTLTSDQLRSGKTTYVAQSGDAGFEFVVYPASGDPVRESTRLIVPAFNAPPEPPPAPAPPAADAEHDALEAQVRQLTADLSKERARADRLQNVVRILEQRLQIQPDGRRTRP